ncbi:hypothetical protein VN0647_14780 [Helicobacter pylori]|nr:hypothetical protein VN0647_14780 [Helicobacter pylori]
MNFFDVILGLFVEPAQKVAEILAKHASSFFHAQLILNTIISILFMIWAYKRVKEGDMFEFKTAMGVVVFIAFVGFINWGIKNPNDFKPPKQKSQISLVFGMNALVSLGTIKTL